MAGEWRENSLGDLITVKHGFAFQGEFIHDESRGDILLTPGNFAVGGGFKSGKFKYFDGPVPEGFVLGEGELLVSMTDLSKQSDTLGFPAFVPSRSDGRRYLHNQRLGKVLVKDASAIDTRFLHYLMCSSGYRHEVLASATGTTVKHTSPERIQRYRFMRPSLSEQRTIAHILGTLDDKIELNRRMNETLEAMALALFQSWFVDFDPVRAKAEGRDPVGIDSETADLFPGSFNFTSDGDAIPSEWIKSTLGDEVDFQTGYAFQSESFSEKPPGIRLARGMNVKEGAFFWDSQSRYWPGLTPDIEGYLLRSGDVLIGMDGSKVGKNWVRVRSSDLPCLLVQRVARLRATSSAGENLLWILVGSSSFRQFVNAVKTGTSIPHISGDQIKSYGFVRPPRNDNRLFNRFEARVTALTAQVDRNCSESLTLNSLRDTLLPKLISGELRVPDAERLLMQVAT